MSDKAILVVDDVKENLDIIVALISPHYKVKAAPNGKVALKISKKTIPDLILLDIVMPGMDGYEVLGELRALSTTASIPVVFVSSNDNADERQKGMDLGASGYLTKPVDPAALLDICRRIIGV
jgi:putative two-component system response regulator